jgi:hypothetical protein
MEATTKYNKDGSICRIIEASNGDFAVDLFPYKIKNRELFYDRNHPKGIAPESFEYEYYWGRKLKDYLEGRWVDDEGTWVFMPPKLDFYINYTLIVDEDQRTIPPRLRDNEWLMAYYDLCAEGFSGFEDDEEYTCNEIVDKLERIESQKEQKDSIVEKIKTHEQKILDESKTIRKPDGTYKKYVNAWIYLTEHYLLTHKKDKPLGQALYENGKSDQMILAARSCGKSFYTFGGDLLHEWLTNGQKNITDFKKYGSDKKLFSVGAVRKDQLERSLAIVKNFYNNQPGSYVYGVDNKGKEDKVRGFLYKNTVGSWDVGGKVEHSVKNTNSTDSITGNVIQMPVITVDSVSAFAGGRISLAIVEEVGFVGFLKRLRSVVYNSLRVGKKKIGRLKGLGTGGLFDVIQEAKEIFENPDGYDIYPIPNYFDKNRAGKIGLFLSVCLQSEELKDKNGNTVYELALEDVIDDREEKLENLDVDSFWEYVAFNPLYPKEMLRPSGRSVLPTVEMSEHRGMLQMTDVWKHRSSVGQFRWNANEPCKVEFKKDLENKLIPILEWGKDKDLHNREGCWVMYEDAMAGRPDNLYYILYDPAAQGGEGTSLHSALVYKHKFVGGNDSLKETFVADFIGRKPRLDENYQEVIKAALYYNAKILVERNVPGFVEWCEQNGYFHMLVNEPIRVLSEVRRQPVKNHGYRKGQRTDEQINKWNLTRLGDWLREPVYKDSDGVPLKFRYQTVYSLRLLDEAVNFTPDRKTEFDHVSAAMLLMSLLLEISDDFVEINENDDDGYFSEKYRKLNTNFSVKKERSAFLKTM